MEAVYRLHHARSVSPCSGSARLAYSETDQRPEPLVLLPFIEGSLVMVRISIGMAMALVVSHIRADD